MPYPPPGPDTAAQPASTSHLTSMEAPGDPIDPHLVVTFAALAVCHDGGECHCGLTLVPRGMAPETSAATDDLPIRADWLQHELRQGPAITPLRQEVLVSKDLAADQRWPDFGRMCAAVLDIRSLVTIPFDLGHGDRALLSFYGNQPKALDHLDVDAALKLRPLAALAAARVASRHRAALRDASDSDFSRVAIALGTVMARHHLTPPKAFDLLRQACRILGHDLLEVAVDIVRTGRLSARVAHLLGPWTSPNPAPVGGPGLWHTASSPARGS